MRRKFIPSDLSDHRQFTASSRNMRRNGVANVSAAWQFQDQEEHLGDPNDFN